ncbi:MAG: lysophospholipase [Leptospiraceae bacterium]|nr:lysophospholipase [Leptospiraceae bacterium]
MAYKNTQDFFHSSIDGTRLFYQSWQRVKPGTGRVMVFQHGFGEHSDRYGNLLNKFKNSDVNFYALDSRGHGRSDGKRGHVDQFQLYIDDLSDLIKMVKEKEGVQKIFLLGHSLGGVIVLQYAVQGVNQESLHALLVCSPALKVKMNLDKQIKKKAAGFLAKFFPAVTLDANLDLKYISHDQATIDAYKADPLVHGKVSFQMATNLFHLSRSIREKAGIIKVPVYLIHGSDDGIIDVEGSKELYQHLVYKNKQFKIYQGLYHELMNETPEEREKVLTDLKGFVDSIQHEKNH